MSPRIVVPDASVLLKWVLKSRDEPDTEKARRLMYAWLEGKYRLLLPSLWIYEVGNVLGAKQPGLAKNLLETLVAMKFEEADPGKLLGDILKLMQAYCVTFYDASYHAIALAYQGVFLTADSRYVERAKKAGSVILLREWPDDEL